MMRVKTLLLICAGLMALVYYGCGTDSKDTIYICQETTEYWAISGGPIPADLAGSYSLSDVRIDFYTVFGNHIKTATKADFEVAEGYQLIDSMYMEQSISYAGSIHLTGNWYVIPSDAYYLFSVDGVTWNDASSGTLYIDGGWVPFSATENVLSITWAMGCFLLEETETSGEEPEPAMSPTFSEPVPAVKYKERWLRHYPVLR